MRGCCERGTVREDVGNDVGIYRGMCEGMLKDGRTPGGMCEGML